MFSEPRKKNQRVCNGFKNRSSSQRFVSDSESESALTRIKLNECNRTDEEILSSLCSLLLHLGLKESIRRLSMILVIRLRFLSNLDGYKRRLCYTPLTYDFQRKCFILLTDTVVGLSHLHSGPPELKSARDQHYTSNFRGQSSLSSCGRYL